MSAFSSFGNPCYPPTGQGRVEECNHVSPTRESAQFWDKDRLVAKELQQQLSSSQLCCQRNGIIWDVAALYPNSSSGVPRLCSSAVQF